MEASSDSKLEIGGYTDHQRFNGERHMARILKIICGFLDGGEGVGKVWVGFGVALIFIGIFWKQLPLCISWVRVLFSTQHSC